MFFAPVLFAMIRNTANALSPAWWSVLLFFIIPEVTCLLGLLLWASPILSSELEGKTWLYLAVRPGGKAANLWGKYISAVIWTAMSAFVSLLFSLSLVDSDDIFRLLLTMSALVVLSCLAYGALFTLLGVVFQKRAMVVAVAYTILFEGIVSLIPAVINQLIAGRTDSIAKRAIECRRVLRSIRHDLHMLVARLIQGTTDRSCVWPCCWSPFCHG